MYPIYWRVTIWSLIRNSQIMVKANWTIIRKSRKLLVKPILALLLYALVCAGLWFALDTYTPLFDPGTGIQQRITLIAGASLSAGLAIGIISILIQGVMVSAIYKLIAGSDLSAYGTRGTVFKRIIGLFSWAVIATIAGPLLRVVSWAARGNQHRRLNRAVMHTIGEWNAISYLVVPSIVIENVGSFKSITRSKKLLRSTWGEYLTARISFGWFAFALIFPVLIIGSAFGILSVWDTMLSHLPKLPFQIPTLPSQLSTLPPELSIFVAGFVVVWVIGVVIIFTTLNAVYETVLYLYADARIRDPYLTSWNNLASWHPCLASELLQQCFVPADNS